MKYIYLVLACLGITSSIGCIKVKIPTPDPIPQTGEYFTYYANGKHYYYSQVKNSGLFGQSRTIAALQVSGSLGYKLAACWLDDGVRRGEFEFRLGGNGIPDKDTLMLGPGSVGIYSFFDQLNSYALQAPYSGQIIFTERSNTALKGTFQLQAVKYTNDTLNYDDILTITNGEFYIIPQ